MLKGMLGSVKSENPKGKGNWEMEKKGKKYKELIN